MDLSGLFLSVMLLCLTALLSGRCAWARTLEYAASLKEGLSSAAAEGLASSLRSDVLLIEVWVN